MLTSTEQYALDVVLHAGSVTANKQTNNKLLEATDAVRTTMMIGLTVAPALCMGYVDNSHKNYTTIEANDKALQASVQVSISTPTVYLEDGIMCCDTHRDEQAVDYTQAAELNAVSMDVFKGTQPMQGIAYSHLSRLVRKNAKKQSSIVGML